MSLAVATFQKRSLAMAPTSREFNEEHVPLAYLITFRSYGTWLHGDKRGSMDRHYNRYGSPKIPRNDPWREYNRRSLTQPPTRLDRRRRSAVDAAIRETCEIRKWSLWALNVRSNHVHAVVTANCDPDRVMTAFKANATRKMRDSGCWKSSGTPWVRRGSKKRLWNDKRGRCCCGLCSIRSG
jgi:REP element-mobilizing transposase RayT